MDFRAFSALLCALTIGCAEPLPEVQAEGPRRELGRMTTTPGAEPCPSSNCLSFEVESDDLVESASGRMVVSEPVGEIRGTVVSFSGGGGTGLLGTSRR